MTDPAIYFRGLARNNAWSNQRLLGACAGLSPAELAAPRTGFFPSLRATFNHILVVDWFYVDALEGGRLGPAAWADEEPCLTIEALRREQGLVDRRLVTVCERLDGGALTRLVTVHRGDRDQLERCDRLLLHLFQHQIHHRGQAHGMLSGTSVRPPQLDEFFSEGDAPLRKDELAALGWTEQELWNGWP
jgi:uncharacterized damage-inducible protein DinB